MSSPIEKLPWSKDKELFDAATELLAKRQYEKWVIFTFAMELADIENVDVIFRGRSHPDAVLINAKTEEVLALEFEEYSGDFKIHKHDPQKCDLIVCAHHDWKTRYPDEPCPLPVYVVGDSQPKFFPKEVDSPR